MEPTISEEDSSLATQCLALCQALASQGKAFKFFIKIGSNFSFSLDNRDKSPSTKVEKATSTNLEGRKKKPSPSSLKRNATRREIFLSKQKPPISPEGAAVKKAAAEKATVEKEAAEKTAAEKTAALKRAADEKTAALKRAADKETAALKRAADEKTAAAAAAFSAAAAEKAAAVKEKCVAGTDTFKCERCKVYFESKVSLVLHMENKHRIFQCKYCTYKCTNQSKLKSHTECDHTNEYVVQG